MKHGRTVFVAVFYFSPFLPKKEYANNRGHENVKNAPTRSYLFSGWIPSYLLGFGFFLRNGVVFLQVAEKFLISAIVDFLKSNEDTGADVQLTDLIF